MAHEAKTLRADHEVWEMIAARAAYRGTSLSDYVIAAALARSVFDLEEEDPEAAAAWRNAYRLADEDIRRMNYRGGPTT